MGEGLDDGDEDEGMGQLSRLLSLSHCPRT